MQKTLTPVRQSEDDQQEDNAEDTEEADTAMLSVSIGGQPFCNFQFVDDVALLVGIEEELRQLTERLEKTTADYGMKTRSPPTGGAGKTPRH